jgi:hypothetical protein
MQSLRLGLSWALQTLFAGSNLLSFTLTYISPNLCSESFFSLCLQVSRFFF